MFRTEYSDSLAHSVIVRILQIESELCGVAYTIFSDIVYEINFSFTAAIFLHQLALYLDKSFTIVEPQ